MRTLSEKQSPRNWGLSRDAFEESQVQSVFVSSPKQPRGGQVCSSFFWHLKPLGVRLRQPEGVHQDQDVRNSWSVHPDQV